MPRYALLLAAGLTAACGKMPALNPDELGCSGLELRLLEQAIAPPANVATVVRVTACGDKPTAMPLGAGDFALLEDDKSFSPFEAKQVIRPAERTAEEYTLIALDLSGSITRAELKPSMIEGARRLAHSLAPAQRVALFGFDGRPDLVPYAFFTADPAALDEGLDRMLSSPIIDDSTNLFGAVTSGLEILDKQVGTTDRDPKKLGFGTLVVFTDGTDRAGRVSESDARSKIDDSAHATIAIAVGAELDDKVLADLGRTAHLRVDDGAGVLPAFSAVAEQVKSMAARDFLVSYCSPARAGHHRLSIKVTQGDLRGSANLDFEAAGFGAGCDPEASPLH